MEKNETVWKDRWQEQKSTHLDLDQLIRDISSIEKKARFDRIKLIVGIPVLTIWLSFIFPILKSGYYLIFIITFCLGMFMILLQNFINKQFSLRDNLGLENLTFRQTYMVKLNDRLKTAAIYLWIAAVVLVFSFNVLCLEAIKEFHWTIRLVIHSLFSITIPVLISKRMKMYNNQVLPLIEKLENIF